MRISKTSRAIVLTLATFFALTSTFWAQSERYERTGAVNQELRDRYTQADYENYLERLRSGEIQVQGPESVSALDPDVLVNNNNGSTGTSNFTQSEMSIIAWSNFVVIAFNDAGSYTGSNNQFTGWAYSTNGGVSFIDGGTLPTSTIGDAGDPVLARNETTGRIYLSTLGFNSPGTIQMWRADYSGGAFTWMTTPVNATPGGSSEDKQWHTVDNFPGPGNGNVYVISRRFGTGPGIYVFRSTDHGNTFGPSGGVNIVSGNQGAFIAVGPDHSVYAFWYTTGAIMMRKSTDFGATFGSPVTVASGLVGGVNGDLGLTGIRQGTTTPASFRSNEFPHVAINPISGNIYVTYANDGVGVDKADVFFVQSTNGGTTWSAPFKINDDATTTDQWMPTITVTPTGSQVGIFYLSRQEDPANNNLFKCYGRIGMISGPTVTWGNPSFSVSDVPSLPEFGRDAPIVTTYMGDYQHATATPAAFHVSWSDNRDDLPGGAPRKDPNVYYKKIPTTENFGWVQGTVTSTAGGAPVAGIQIDFVENIIQVGAYTDSLGRYFAGVRVDTPATTVNVTLRARKFGYVDTTLAITITRNDTLTRNFQIRPSPSGTLSVHSHTATTNLRSYVEVKFGTQTVVSDSTNATTGLLTATLPAGTYSVRVDAPPPNRTLNFPSVVINAGQTTNVDALTGPVLTFNPTAVRDTLPVGGSRIKDLTITNTTPDSVRFRITDDNALSAGRFRIVIPEPLNPLPAIEKPKGAPDTEFGTSPLGRGGPDGFGYSWIDSDEPDGPAFSWVDIKAVGTQITTWTGSGDDGYAQVTLPFTFSFYGNNYTSAFVGTNGFLSFGTGYTTFTNTAIPSTATPNNAIYAFWDDLNFNEPGGTAWYYFDAANQRYIVQWDSVSHYLPSTTPGRYTFQIVLNPNGEILTYYRRMLQTVNSATIGIENAAGTVGLQVVFNATYMHDSLAIRFFLPDAPWLSESPVIGTIPPGGNQIIQCTFNAAGLTPGTLYRANIFVDATHPDVTTPFVVPASLQVQSASQPLLVLNKDSLLFPTTAIGSSRTDSITARNVGALTLNISSITRNNTDFSVTPSSATVPPNDSIKIRVTYTPTVPAGPDTGRLTIVSNSSVDPTRYVRLNANSVGVPIFRTSQDSLTKTLQARNVDSTLFFVRNIGTMNGNFSARAVMYPRNEPGMPGRNPIIIPMTITPIQENPKMRVALSEPELMAIVGPAPRSAASPVPGPSPLGLLGELVGERAFGYEYFTANFVKFNLTTPGTLVNLGTFTTGDNIFAGDFSPDGNTLLAIKGSTNQLIRVDTSNGSYTVIGPVTIQSGHTWTSMKVDPTNGAVYATSTNGSVSTLYTINPVTGQTTVVGTVTNVPILIAMAISNSGQMYCYDIESGGTQQSRFFSVDKNTGTGTLIGSMGFIGRFAQDMDFDPQTGVLYAAAYNYGISPATAELRTINVSNGSTTLIGPIGTPQREVDFFAIKGSPSTAGPWLSIAPTSGTIAVNDSLRFTATFDARDISIVTNPGTYYGRVEITATNSALAESLNIPARFTVTPISGPALYVTPDSVNFGNVPINQTDSSKSVLVKNIGSVTTNVTNIVSNNPAFAALTTNFSLAPNDTQRVRLRFTAPSPGGLRTGLLSFTTNDPNPPTIFVRGTSVGQASIVVTPDTFTLVLPASGDTTLRTFRIRNPGTDTLRYNIDEAFSSGDSPGSVERSMEQQEAFELPKGATGDRGGEPGSPTGRGGPDAFGYIWIDSDEPGGPQFNWVDIRPLGATPLILTDDNNQGPFPLGFNVSFYGNTYNSIRVCSNGFLSFTSTATTFTNTAIPTTTEPNNALYAFWDDLNPAATGRQDTVYYYADAANQRFIVQYQNVRRFADPTVSQMTFQAIIYANGNVVYQYLNMVGVTNDATIGIENATGTIALQVVFNQAYMHNNLAILLTRDLFGWMSVMPTSGTIAPGDSQTVQLRIHPAGLAPGTYTGRQRITGNTPDVGRVGVRLDVPVGVGSELTTIPTRFGLEQNYPNPFNPVTTITYGLPVESAVRLRVYNILGQEVARLVDATQGAAYYTVQWDGRTLNGATVSSGIYFFRIDATPTNGGSTFTHVKKMLMLK